MAFPGTVDLVPSINATRTLGEEQHTQLHLDTYRRIERVQAYIGGPPAGGEPDIPQAASTIRERLVVLEAAAKSPAPVLKMLVNQLPSTSAPSVNWDAVSGTVTFGIPAGIQGEAGPAGASTAIQSGTLAEAVYQPGVAVKISVNFPGQFGSVPKVFPGVVQKGSLSRPLAVAVREVSSVGCVLVVENTGTTALSAEINWMAIP